MSSGAATISVRGTMTWRTTLSANSIARPTMTRSLSWRTPFLVETATSILSSSSLWTFSSSLGRIPTHRRMALALTLTSVMKGYMTR